MKFITYAPGEYNERGGGCIALHRLAHNIALCGEESYIMSDNTSANYKSIVVSEDEAKELAKGDAIVIYPEVIERNPLNAKNVVKGYDKSIFVHHKMRYVEFYDNTDTLIFRGWKDECIEFCDNIGLQGFKVNCAKEYEKIFLYDTNNNFIKYVSKLIDLAGLSRFKGSYLKFLSDEEANEYISHNKEAPVENKNKKN